MGTDIHPVIQRREKDGEPWELVPYPKEWWLGEHDAVRRDGSTYHSIGGWYDSPIKLRNYDLFAVLANVRNGVGFAGIERGDVKEFIQENRGLPDDFVTPLDKDTNPDRYAYWHAKYPTDYPEDALFDMGDHDLGWVSLRELQDYPWTEKHANTGLLSEKEYAAWDKQTAPPEYCLDASGPGIHIRTRDEADSGPCHCNKWDHYVRVSWESSVIDDVGRDFLNFIEWLGSLGKPDDVRVVFGFDS